MGDGECEEGESRDSGEGAAAAERQRPGENLELLCLIVFLTSTLGTLAMVYCIPWVCS